jgi:phosphomannomutase
VDRLLAGYSGGAFRIGWDNGNGAAGACSRSSSPSCRVSITCCSPRSTAPSPIIIPIRPRKRTSPTSRKLVAEKNLDFGIAFDGDADRIGAIDGQGRVVWGDQLLSILAEPVLKAARRDDHRRREGEPGAVRPRRRTGRQALMWKTGHSLIKVKMKETGSPLAGEMSGHIFFAHNMVRLRRRALSAVRLIGAVRVLGKPR